MAISRTGKVAVPDKIGGLIANSASELGNFFGFRAMLNSKVSLLRMIGGTASFYQKNLKVRSERVEEIERGGHQKCKFCTSYSLFALLSLSSSS